MLNLNLMSNATQRILSQSNNISYGVRGIVRVNATPEDRKADYLFRDFYMVLVTAYLTELGFRGLETMYTVPLMTKALDLHRLSELYPGAKNYDRLPDAFRSHVLGSLVKSQSMSQVPELMARANDAKKGGLTEVERKQAEILIDHLYKKLNYRGYVREKLVQAGEFSADDAKWIIDEVKRLAEVQPKAADGAKSGFWRNLARNFRTPIQIEAKLNELQEAELAKIQQKLVSDGKADDVVRKFTTAIREGIESDMTLNLLKRIQKSGTWPKMITSVLLTFVFYGLIANYIDVKILQPWQEKLVKERGTSNDVVKPAYQALLPGAAVLTAGLLDKTAPGFIRRMGYFNRFAVVGLAALVTYTLSLLALAKRNLSRNQGQTAKPPVTEPEPPVEKAPLAVPARPSVHRPVQASPAWQPPSMPTPVYQAPMPTPAFMPPPPAVFAQHNWPVAPANPYFQPPY